MAKASMVLFAIVMLSCRSAPPANHVWFSDDRLTNVAINSLLRANPLAPDQNIRVTNLGSTEATSHHFLQVRHGETLHIHRTHDLTIFVHHGAGRMILGTNELSVGTGDVVFVPRGVAHRFMNTGREPAVAIVAFTPALVTKDFEEISGK